MLKCFPDSVRTSRGLLSFPHRAYIPPVPAQLHRPGNIRGLRRSEHMSVPDANAQRFVAMVLCDLAINLLAGNH